MRGSYRNSHVSYVVCSFTTSIASPLFELPTPMIGPPPEPVQLLASWLAMPLVFDPLVVPDVLAVVLPAVPPVAPVCPPEAKPLAEPRPPFEPGPLLLNAEVVAPGPVELASPAADPNPVGSPGRSSPKKPLTVVWFSPW